MTMIAIPPRLMVAYVIRASAAVLDSHKMKNDVTQKCRHQFHRRSALLAQSSVKAALNTGA